MAKGKKLWSFFPTGSIPSLTLVIIKRSKSKTLDSNIPMSWIPSMGSPLKSRVCIAIPSFNKTKKAETFTSKSTPSSCTRICANNFNTCATTAWLMLSKTPFKALKFWSKAVNWSINKVDSSTMANPSSFFKEEESSSGETFVEKLAVTVFTKEGNSSLTLVTYSPKEV